MISKLVVVRQKSPEQMFVGKITSEKAHNATLLKNFKARKEGKVPQLGALVNSNQFDGLEVLVLEREIADFARDCNLPPVPLSEFATETRLVTSAEPGAALQNTVYLPLISAAAPAVTSLTDIALDQALNGEASRALQADWPTKSKSCDVRLSQVQIILDPRKAIDSYVASFFNTALGQKIRQLATSRPDKDADRALLETSVYLPDVKVQEQVIQLDAAIRDSSTNLGEFRRKLWRFPCSHKTIEKRLGPYNRSDDEAWIEALPFPLASILLEYYADSDVKEKLGHLLHFFQALPQYNAALLLSAYAADPSFYAQYKKSWLEEDFSHNEWILHPPLGTGALYMLASQRQRDR